MADSSTQSWEKLGRLRRRLRQLTWWSGISRCLIVLMAGVVIAGWLDWWLRLEDLGVRLLAAGTVWGASIWTVWKTLIIPLRAELSDVTLAAQIDRHYPEWQHRVTAAAEFRGAQSRSGELDTAQGSSELQQLVIRQAEVDLEKVQAEELLSPRSLRPWFAGGLAACALAAGLLWAYPADAAIALRRLSWPWQAADWPRTTELQLRTADGRPLEWDPERPLRIVRDSTLRLEVENRRGGLPDDLRLLQRVPDQQLPEIVPLQSAGIRKGSRDQSREFAIAEILAHQDALEFRVAGGDDQTSHWYMLEAIDPPRILDIRMEVQPPAYTGRPSEIIPAGATQIRALLGSRLVIQGQADRDIARVELRVADQPEQFPTIAADRRRWQAELVVQQPGVSRFSFVLRDAEGFAEPAPLAFELRGEVDALPEVQLKEPATDQLITPDATIALEMEARDDLGVTRLRQSWQRQDLPPETRELQNWPTPQRQVTLQNLWPLTSLQLQPGERLVFRVEALDACDLGEPHVGKSVPRTLTVVSPAEKQRELTERIAEIVDNLREGFELQDRLQQRTLELQTQLRDVGTLQPADRDQLHRLQMDQRRLGDQLADNLRGVGRRAALLRREFPENGLRDAEAEPQLEQLSEQLAELGRVAFPALDSELTQAIKAVDPGIPGVSPSQEDAPKPNPAGDSPSPPVVADAESPASQNPGQKAADQALSRARQMQQETAELLKERHQELAHWESDRHLANSLDAATSAQQALNKDVSQLGAETLSRSLSELSPQQRADLNKLADRQRQLSQQVEQMEKDFQELAERLEKNDPLRAAAAEDMADQLKKEQLGNRLRQAGDDVAANQLGAAGPLQQAAEEALKGLAQQWSEGRPDDAEQMLKRTEVARQSARSLQEEVDELRKKIAEPSPAGGSMDAETREEQREEAMELRKQAQRLERELQRLKLRKSAELAAKAGQKLKTGEQSLDGGAEESAGQSLEEAKQDLEELQEELAQARQELADRLAQEEIERVVGRLQSLKVRQEGVVAETKRLILEQQTSGRLTRGQLRSLQDLAGVEAELVDMARGAEQKLQQAVVAASAVASVARSLEQAANRLKNRQADAVTLMLEQDAVRRLTRVIEAWKQQAEAKSEQEAAAQNSQEGEQEAEKSADPPGESVPLQLQLRLLRELQADCLDRTTQLEQARQPNGELPADLLPLMTDLATEQGELIALAEKLATLYRQQQEATPANAPPQDDSPSEEAKP